MKIRMGFVSNSSSCNYTICGRLYIDIHGLNLKNTNVKSLFSPEDGWVITADKRTELVITNGGVNYNNFTEYVSEEDARGGNFEGVTFSFIPLTDNTTQLILFCNVMKGWGGTLFTFRKCVNKYLDIVLDAVNVDKEKLSQTVQYEQWPVIYGDGWGGDPMGPGQTYDGNENLIHEDLELYNTNMTMTKGAIPLT